MRLQPQSAIAKRYAVQAISEHRIPNNQPLLLNDGLQELQVSDRQEIALQDQAMVLILYAVAPTLVIVSLLTIALALALAVASLPEVVLAAVLAEDSRVDANCS